LLLLGSTKWCWNMQAELLKCYLFKLKIPQNISQFYMLCYLIHKTASFNRN
jgi:hypothetical protein